MQHQDKTNRLAELAIITATNVADFLLKDFDFAGFHYHATSSVVYEMIKKEINTVISSLVLTPKELELFKNTDVQSFSRGMAGTIKWAASFNIVTGSGITASGLTKVYFDSLSAKALALFKDMILPYDSVRTPAGWYENEESGQKVYTNATHDVLKGDFKERKKAIVLAFGQELLKHANLAFAKELANNYKLSDGRTDNSLVGELRLKRKTLFKSFGKTNSFVAYLDHLIAIYAFPKMLCALFSNQAGNGTQLTQPLPYDIAEHMALILVPDVKSAAALRQSLFFVRKAVSIEYKKEVESEQHAFTKKLSN